MGAFTRTNQNPLTTSPTYLHLHLHLHLPTPTYSTPHQRRKQHKEGHTHSTFKHSTPTILHFSFSPSSFLPSFLSRTSARFSIISDSTPNPNVPAIHPPTILLLPLPNTPRLIGTDLHTLAHLSSTSTHLTSYLARPDPQHRLREQSPNSRIIGT